LAERVRRSGRTGAEARYRASVPTPVPSSPDRIVVVGASLAGLRAVEELRRLGFAGTLTLVGAEPHLPYDRPPLSKDFLAGTTDADGIALRRLPYDDLDLDLRLGVRATGLDVAGRVVATEAGEIPYDGVVIATGAVPRRLPNQPDLPGIHVLRTIDDAAALKADLTGAARVVVVGAGFIGAEVAATCRARGHDVTVLEALPSPMVRGLGPVLGDTLAALHRDHGVDLRLSVGVAGFEGTARVERVLLDDGSAIDADVVLVGVGAVPATDWLLGSGLTIDNGVLCDETLLAAPGVVAAGDIARWPNPAFGGEVMRLEHWTNATEQGVAAAARLLAADGEAQAFSSVPFVWSDQYDVKIQVVGHVRGDDDLEVVDGALDERRFVAVFGRGGRLVGAVAFSRPRLLMQYRRLLVEGATFADALAFAQQ
jgi:NADPH-dependent 2,4-dienoyl-CoA reductase/sulfur reductase-like enzyme